MELYLHNHSTQTKVSNPHAALVCFHRWFGGYFISKISFPSPISPSLIFLFLALLICNWHWIIFTHYLNVGQLVWIVNWCEWNPEQLHCLIALKVSQFPPQPDLGDIGLQSELLWYGFGLSLCVLSAMRTCVCLSFNLHWKRKKRMPAC